MTKFQGDAKPGMSSAFAADKGLNRTLHDEEKRIAPPCKGGWGDSSHRCKRKFQIPPSPLCQRGAGGDFAWGNGITKALLAPGIFPPREIGGLRSQNPRRRHRSFAHTISGFTLIEIIIAIVVIGIAVPAIMIPFSGIKDVKKPEDAVRAALLAQKQMEAVSGKAYSEIPAAGSYTCAQFQTTLSVIDCANTEFDFNWTVENVAASAPNTAVGSPDFGKKVTLAVSRFDGAMSSTSFYTLF
ncbi:MAG: prepilin-type N-terminal cleavage/methylation domain-containing protein [Nitrospinae bacterium]|nr:prepilin-type N-terminal cleavage/methylation domain-containing protein [Nitrospinota bacterium]